MRPLVELFESTRPYDRPALSERIEALAASECAGGQPGSMLLDQQLSALHPASWYVPVPHLGSLGDRTLGIAGLVWLCC